MARILSPDETLISKSPASLSWAELTALQQRADNGDASAAVKLEEMPAGSRYNAKLLVKTFGGKAGKMAKSKKSKLDKALEKRSRAIEKAARIAGKAHQASLLKTAAGQLAASPEKWARLNSMTVMDAMLQNIVFTSENPAEREAARDELHKRGVLV